MADFKQNYFQRRTKDRGPRSNNRISSPEVQVIASDGENLGILNTNEAISLAKVPLLLICGKKEVDSNSVTIRRMDSNKQENMDLNLFLKKFSAFNKASSN